MKTNKALIIFTLVGIIGLTNFSLGRADYPATPPPTDATTKNGAPNNPNYAPTDANVNAHADDPSHQPNTIPSGKRHRTHTKRNHKAENADAQKTINSGDVTPAK